MPKISELSNPGSGHSVTGGELIVVTTQGLSSISLSANDLVNRALDVIDTGTGANLKSTYTSFNANSAEYESAYSTLKSNSAEYESAYSTLKSNSGSYTYVASNSATLQADTTVAGSLSTNDTLIIGGRGTFGSDHIVTDNILTVFGNISAQGTIYASGSALGDVDPVNPGGSNRTIQYNDSNAFGGAPQFAYDETNHNVGIGTQAIAIADNIHEKLTVAGNISATGKLYNEDGEVSVVSPGGTDGAVQFNNSSTLSGNASLTFDDTNVRLGIGTSSPTANLHVTADGPNGNYLAYVYNTGLQGNDHGLNTQIASQSATAYGLRVNTGANDNALAVMGDGNVGIGTAAPNGKLSVRETTTDTECYVEVRTVSNGGGDPYIKFDGGGTNFIVGEKHVGSTNNYLVLGPGENPDTTSGIFVKGGGDVGIGTTAPTSLLHLSGAGSPILTISSPDANARAIQFDDGGAMAAQINCDSSENLEFKTGGSATNKAIILANGKVGIGTDAPLADLHVQTSDISVTPNANADNLVVEEDGNAGISIISGTSNTGNLTWGDTTADMAAISYSHSTNNMSFRVNSTNDVMTLSSAATIGIGTETPAYKLHVAAPNTSTIAISAFGEIHAGGDIQSSSSSDKRQKKNIKNLENALDKVATLDGVEYDWNELASAHRIGKHDVGVIAQQVEEVLPDAIERRENGMMAVRYERLIPLLIESIKELKSEIDELKSK